MKDFVELAKKLIEDAKSFTPDETRAGALRDLAGYIKKKRTEGKPARLNFICTHNSRRSHFGQVMAQVLATYLKLPEIETFSGGTEATAFHPNAVAALRDLGVTIEKLDDSKNPRYKIATGATQVEAFSKVYTDKLNPKSDFAAIVVCSTADAGCPFVVGAEKRLSLPFEDPKVSDGTPQQAALYRDRAIQIGTELAWSFQRIESLQ